MDPSQYQKLQETYLAIRDLPPELRDDKLTDLRNESNELATQVQRLLDSDLGGGDFLNEPIVKRSSFPVLETNELLQTNEFQPAKNQQCIPKSIGPYKILQQIGEGGHGVVFMAEQTKPIRRKVAIKWVKPGLDSKAILARFDAERQALAMMNHPSIANVLDANSTDDGQPYFVMELVHGVPIDQFCTDNQLGLDDRLKLFQQVCGAVHHAHRKGIIHRDIKPGNVLVTVDSGKPLAKVIDFGIAKALHMPLTEKTMYTEFGQIIGTLEYMSPEQALMSQTGIDIRSDVYSLGVLLYLLITGETPLSKKELLEKGVWELTNVLKNARPDTPSSRITSQNESVRWKDHNVSRQTWLPQVKGDLDWVTMKALAKEPELRYDSASQFAEDIENYLIGDSVTARPPTTWYKLTKFVKRNRVAAAVFTTIGLAMIISIAASTWGYFQSQNNLTALTEANELINQKAIALEKEKLRADQNSKRLAKMLERNILESAWKSSLNGDFKTAQSTLTDIDKQDRNFVWKFVEAVGQQMELPIIRTSQLGMIRELSAQTELGLIGAITAESALEVWNANGSEPVKSIPVPASIYTAMSFDEEGNWALLGASGGKLMLVDLQTDKIQKTVTIGKGGIRAIVHDPNNSRWYVTTGANFVFALQQESLEVFADQRLPDRISKITAQPNGEHLVVSSLTGDLFILPSNLKSFQEIKGIKNEVAAFAWSDNRLIACDWQGAIYKATMQNNTSTDLNSILNSPKKFCQLPEPPEAVDIADSGTVFAAGKSGQIYSCEDSEDSIVTIRKFSSAVKRLAYLDGSKSMLVAFVDGKLGLINESEIQKSRFGYEALSGLQDAIALSSVDYAMTGYADGKIKCWNTSSGVLLRESQSHDDAIFEIDVNERSCLVASVGADKKIVISQVSNLSTVHEMKCDWGVRCVTFSSDGTILAGPPDPENKQDLREGTIDLWDVESGKPCLRLPGHQNWVTHIRFIDDDKSIITLSVDGTAKIWSASSGKLMRTIELSFAPLVRSLAVSNQNNLYLGHDDGSISVWDTATGTQLLSKSISGDSVVGLCLSKDQHCLVAVPQSGPELVLLDTESLNVQARLDAGVGNILGMSENGDGGKLQILGESGAIRIWEIPN